MDSRWVLQEQIEELQRRLNRISNDLSPAEQKRTAIEARLLKRVRLHFQARIQEKSGALAEARRMAADPAHYSLAECWDVFRPTLVACQPLLAEALAVLEGALARSEGLDDGFCDAADQLVAEISQYALNTWTTFTILYEGELYSTLADVIRIRYPSAGVWDLPIAAHECGHFISRKVWVRDATDSSRDAFQDFLIANHAEPGSPLRNHLNEYFADVFATFALGLAYAFSALLRFDASRPDEEGETHPSPAKRAYVILQTLEWMDRQSVERPFAGLIQELRSQWQPPHPKTCVELDDYLDSLHPMIERNFRLARYETWSEAAALAYKVSEGPQAAQGFSVRDMLNAAWLARIRMPGSRDQIAAAVKKWILQEAAAAARAAHA